MIVFTISTDKFSFPQKQRESQKLVSKIGLNKWNIYFPLEHSARKKKKKRKKRKQDFFRCSVAHHGKFALERTIITRVSYTLATRKFRNLLANVIKPTICRSCCRRCRACLRSLLSEQTMNIHKIYLLWRVGFRHQRWDYQQLIVESSAK